MLFLVGLRGSGKTTVGRLLAQALALPFYDADVELEAKAGRSIREIFAKDGETVFRNLEALILHELIGRGPAVIATGGGVVLRE
jgi:shikimate kinase